MKLLSVLFIVSINYVLAESFVPVISLAHEETLQNTTNKEPMKFLPFIMLIEKDKDTSEYWRETEVLSLVQNNDADIDFEQCNTRSPEKTVVQFPSLRTIRPICKTTYDYQLCPQCPRFSNETECELFRDSCKERRVYPSEYRTYCDKKYGKWRAMFIPADPVQCRCCDECIFYRELDQSCVQDEYNFDADEFLPVTTLDFRAGCNPYWGHPEQELRALRCDKILRRFSGWELTKSPATASVNIIRLITGVPVTIPILPSETLNVRRSFRFEPPSAEDCPVWCRGWECAGGQVSESRCPPGAFLPDRDTCNCCGRCSTYQQLNQKCAEFKKTVHNINGTKETEVEEEFLEPGCDDGLVCRQGLCQDIHAVHSATGVRRKRDEGLLEAYEPCKKELKYFKKKYGKDGHLHFNAPQCTPLWLYAAVQCRRFVCYCALEDGTFVKGVKVPRVEVSNMNCDCVREKCRTGSDVQCDGYGNYKDATFTPHVESWRSGTDTIKRGNEVWQPPVVNTVQPRYNK